MANKKFPLVQNDTLPQIELFLTDKATGKAVDLSAGGTSIRMRLRPKAGGLVKEVLILSKLTGLVVDIDDATGAQTVKLTGYENAGSGGRCAVQWSATSLDTPGDYIGEVEVTFAGGGKQTWYDFLQFTVRPEVG